MNGTYDSDSHTGKVLCVHCGSNMADSRTAGLLDIINAFYKAWGCLHICCPIRCPLPVSVPLFFFICPVSLTFSPFRRISVKFAAQCPLVIICSSQHTHTHIALNLWLQHLEGAKSKFWFRWLSKQLQWSLYYELEARECCPWIYRHCMKQTGFYFLSHLHLNHPLVTLPLSAVVLSFIWLSTHCSLSPAGAFSTVMQPDVLPVPGTI